MIKVEIPGRETLELDYVVFDYNGTIAVDGILVPEIVDQLAALKELAEVYVLTADTYGTVKQQCEPLGLTVKTFPRANAADCKLEIVTPIASRACCIGNGFNDVKMLTAAKLGIAILGEEGLYPGLLNCSDVLVKSPVDALDLLLKTDRLKATLRT